MVSHTNFGAINIRKIVTNLWVTDMSMHGKWGGPRTMAN